MNDDRNNYNDENIDSRETPRNDFSNSRDIYNPSGNYDEGQAFGYSSSNHDDKRYNSEDIKKIVQDEVYKAKPKSMWVKFVAVALVFSLLGSGVTGLIMGKVFGGKSSIGSNGGNTTSQVINVKDDGNVENAVGAKAIPSVVGITTSTKTNNPFFNQQSYVEGVGSGVIITKDGFILTNSHVVSDGSASEINVILSDGEKIAAKLIWNDSDLDLAVVKVEKAGLSPVEMGDSDDVSIGDKAIAIGNPLGLDLQSTLTSGIISGLNRTIRLENNASMDGLMQTDASINSGNSGGALLNSKGQLIGINTAKASQGEGIGFAIPINTIKPIVDKIIETGNFEIVTLGVQGTDLEVYENSFDIDTGADKGAAIMQVDDKSPAGKAGLKQGDIVTKVGDSEVKDMASLRKSLVKYSFGDTAEVTIIRNGKDVKLDITFEKYEVKQTEQNQGQNNQENQNNFFNPFGGN